MKNFVNLFGFAAFCHLKRRTSFPLCHSELIELRSVFHRDLLEDEGKVWINIFAEAVHVTRQVLAHWVQQVHQRQHMTRWNFFEPLLDNLHHDMVGLPLSEFCQVFDQWVIFKCKFSKGRLEDGNYHVFFTIPAPPSFWLSFSYPAKLAS